MKSRNHLIAMAISCLIPVGSACACSPKANVGEHDAAGKQADEPRAELSNKQKVWALQSSIETHDPVPITYINPDKYIQHNVNVGDGLAAIFALHELLPRDTTKARPARVFQDGDFTFIHVDYDLWGPKAGFDIHRFDNGRIVEHWDNLQEKPASTNPSGRGMLDGATGVADLDKTGENKALVRRFAEEGLVGARTEQMDAYFRGDDLLQHDPQLADGASSLKAALAAWASDGTRYEKVHMVLGEGNFVLVVSEGRLAGEHCSFYDLYRVADGKLAEHWGVIELIPPREQWKNTNGKF
jgi:predicted SnoaL-like aldol condensation-catalyzing enzyme